MNKSEIVAQLAEQEGIPVNEAEVIVDEFIELITARMKREEETQIYGFGKFGVRWWKGRTGRDPQTGEEIEIDGRWIPYWSPSSTLIEEGDSHPREEEPEPAAIEETPLEDERAETKPEEENTRLETGEELADQVKEALGEIEKEVEEPTEVEDDALTEEPSVEDTEPEPEPERTTSTPEPEMRWVPPGAKRELSSRQYIWVAAALIALVAVMTFIFFPRDETGIADVESTVTTEVPSETPAEPVPESPPAKEQPESQPAEETNLAENEPVTPVKETPSETPAQPEETPSSPERASVIENSRVLPEEAPPPVKSLVVSTSVEPYRFEPPQRENFLQIYDQALDEFHNRNYRQAEWMFRRLLISNPPDDYADNAQYWIGECRFGMRDYKEAIREFERVFVFPNTNKVDESLIMMAFAYLRLNDTNAAGVLLKKFRTQYPDSPYSQIANKWINKFQLE